MGEAGRPRFGRFRRGRWLVGLGVVALLAMAIGVVSAVAWDYSSDVVVPDHSGGPYEIGVVAVDENSVTLEQVDTADRAGIYGLQWEGGDAIVTEVIASDDESVTRGLSRVNGSLDPGEETRFDVNVFTGDPLSDRGLPYARVNYESELGPMPAWQIGPSRDTWAIVVHGINGDMRGGLRIAPALAAAGTTPLLISYRNDFGAPPSPDGKHHMGLTEWRDLEAAARFALARGARDLVIVGYSMGGAITTQFMERSPLADRVSALILDSPALDWREILAYGAREIGLPSAAAWPVQVAVGLRIDADWDRLDALRHTDSLQLPILLFHGESDAVVPIELSHNLAAALPEYVEFDPTPDTGHVQIWNHNPAAYEARVRRFLTSNGTAAG